VKPTSSIEAAGIALAWGSCVSVAGYGIVRAIQFFIYPDPNPATLVWSAHAGFFWRCWTCAYAGCLAALVVFVAARRDVRGAARSLVGAVVAAGIILSVQSAFFP
jgi:hypothetical protein